MSNLHILGKPQYVENAGNIYPILVKDWDKFNEHVNFLMYSKKNFDEDQVKDIPLLKILLLAFNDKNIIQSLIEIFNLIWRTDDVAFSEEYNVFVLDENRIISSQNYDQVRKVILEQNLLFEPKVYKDKLMREWAEKVLEARSKNSLDVTFEDIISTVATLSSKHYWDIENYSVYQLNSEFQRIMKHEDYRTMTMAQMNSTEKLQFDHFAEKINLFKNPYDDLFKKKDKLQNINKAIKG